jgi:hypothetical protein
MMGEEYGGWTAPTPEPVSIAGYPEAGYAAVCVWKG